jgi:hypothetical protein
VPFVVSQVIVIACMEMSLLLGHAGLLSFGLGC